MSQEVSQNLGAHCPDGGSFYVCSNKPTRFVGCCTVDPCKTDTGICPADALRTTSFDKYSYNMIEAQNCVSADPKVQWYTCAAIKTPFMGCCNVNPCSENGCPGTGLFAAKLSDEADMAKAFLPSTTASASVTASAEPGAGGDLGTGATIGIAVGASLAGMAILGALIFWFLKKRRRTQPVTVTSPFEPYGSQFGSPRDAKVSPYSPYPSTFTPSPDPQNQYGTSQVSPPQPSPPHWTSSHGPSPLMSQAGFTPSPYASPAQFPSRHLQDLGVYHHSHQRSLSGNQPFSPQELPTDEVSGVGQERESRVYGFTKREDPRPVELEDQNGAGNERK